MANSELQRLRKIFKLSLISLKKSYFLLGLTKGHSSEMKNLKVGWNFLSIIILDHIGVQNRKGIEFRNYIIVEEKVVDRT